MADETINHPAVKAYRDTFRLMPNRGFRRDIVVTVENQELWKTVLSKWGYWKDGKWKTFSPLNIKGLLSEYERLIEKGAEHVR